MAEHNEFGKEGEEEAAAYLIDKGYSIRHRNWHLSLIHIFATSTTSENLSKQIFEGTSNMRQTNGSESFNSIFILNFLAG